MRKKLTVLSLFNGIGVGSQALKNLNVPIQKIYSSEIDWYAIQTNKKNHPEDICLGSITNWKWWDKGKDIPPNDHEFINENFEGIIKGRRKVEGKYVDRHLMFEEGGIPIDNWDIDWGSIDLVTAGFPCFVAGTLVRTKDGLKPIESIELGDFVLTHNNRYREVVELMCKDSDHINNVKIQGSHLLQVTDEHPFYVRSMKRYGKESKRKFSDPEWVECKNLERGKHFVGIPVNREQNESDFNNRPEFWRFMGRWVADGYSSTSNKIKRGSNGSKRLSYRVILTCGLHEEMDVDNLMNSVFNGSFSKSIERTSIKYVVVNKDLWNFVQKFGRSAHNKRIPEFVIDLKSELLIEFIEGYIDGDGCAVRSDNYKSNKNSYSITTVSERLVYGVSAIISKVYGTLPNITKTIRDKKTIIEGREVNQRDTYMIRFHKERPPQAHYFVEGDFIWTPFKSREREKRKA